MTGKYEPTHGHREAISPAHLKHDLGGRGPVTGLASAPGLPEHRQKKRRQSRDPAHQHDKLDNKKTTRVPVLSRHTTRVKTYHLSAKREGDEFFTEGGLVNENSNEGGFLFIMNLKI